MMRSVWSNFINPILTGFIVLYLCSCFIGWEFQKFSEWSGHDRGAFLCFLFLWYIFYILIFRLRAGKR